MQLQEQQVDSYQEQAEFIQKRQDYETVSVTLNYPSQFYIDNNIFTASVMIVPKCSLQNAPLQVQLKGFFKLDCFSLNDSRQQQLEDTETDINPSHKTKTQMLQSYLKQSQLQPPQAYQQNQGEYFLQGCQVLYQLDEQTKQRLQILQSGRKYTYPLEFMLPKNLPVSIDNLLLKGVRMLVRYTIQIKIVAVNQEGSRNTYVLLTDVQFKQPVKTYPYQILAIKQIHRCYHEQGKKQDPSLQNTCAKLIKCLCPSAFFDNYMLKNRLFSTIYKGFDVFYLQVTVVVTMDHNLFVNIRSYRQPQSQSLISNRITSKKTNIKGQQLSNQISIASLKPTQRKNQSIIHIQKVQLQLFGELVGISQQSLLKQEIFMHQSSFEMLEGEAVFRLREILPFTQSHKNELFTMKYYFKVNAFFRSSQAQNSTFEMFKMYENLNEILL